MKFKTTAENRKDIVKAIEEITGVKSIYVGAPTFCYKVGDFSIDKEGSVETENERAGKQMQSELIAKGLAEGEKDKLNIDIPMEGFTAESLKNLIYLIHSKQYLLEKAVGVKALEVSDTLVEMLKTREGMPLEETVQMIVEHEPLGMIFTQERISFCEFPFSIESANVYTRLVSAMAQMAKSQKRINPQQCLEENEKYYMRVWLIRLGFGGKDGKEVRNTLLTNLKGHTAFRTEAEIERAKERNKARKQNATEA